jgi:F0F1-type ATP synthase epsilon subunit
MADMLRFTIRTPHDVIVDTHVSSVRVLTETGHVGLRARMEPLVLAIEAGLVLMRSDGSTRFAGSAGGLLACDGVEATLFTALGVVGNDTDAVQSALARALAEPGAEQQVRATLDKLEGRILTELRRRPETGMAIVEARQRGDRTR